MQTIQQVLSSQANADSLTERFEALIDQRIYISVIEIGAQHFPDEDFQYVYLQCVAVQLDEYVSSVVDVSEERLLAGRVIDFRQISVRNPRAIQDAESFIHSHIARMHDLG